MRRVTRFMLTDTEPVSMGERIEDCELCQEVLRAMPGHKFQPVHHAMVVAFDDAATHAAKNQGHAKSHPKPDPHVGNKADRPFAKHSSHFTSEKTSTFAPGVLLVGAHTTSASGKVAGIVQKVVLPAAATEQPIEVVQLQHLRADDGAPPRPRHICS